MATKKDGAYGGRNQFKHFSLRPKHTGQLEHWQEYARKHGFKELSELIRVAVDKFTGFVAPKEPKK